MKSKILGIALFVTTAATVFFYPSVRGAAVVPVDADPAMSQASKIEVVFVLDTTGSMGGLIDAAKEKIWSIATTMAQAPSAPQIRIGLVAFRDRGDDYVTKVVDLSTDLDSVYATLMDFDANGGGDGPESVNAALDAAINQFSWSAQNDSYQVVFLVGDAPPHMDYLGERQYPELVSLAKQKGILVNAIRCGNDSTTEHHWQQIASLAGGSYFSVGQDGDAVAIATPFDEEIAALSRKLDETRLVFGDNEIKEEFAKKSAATDKLHGRASVASRARRAIFNMSASGADNQYGDNDLVDAVASGDVELDDIPADELPATMQVMSEAERVAEVQKIRAARQDLNTRITDLAGKRDGFLQERAGATEGINDSLDYRLYDTVREQAAGKGILYEAAAPKM